MNISLRLRFSLLFLQILALFMFITCTEPRETDAPEFLSEGTQVTSTDNLFLPDAEAIKTASTAEDPYSGLTVYFGDLHCHTSYSLDAHSIGQPPKEALTYARDQAKLDFVAITDHAELLRKSSWEDIQQQCNDFNSDHQFVSFIGFEFSEPTSGGGHKQVIFKGAKVFDKPMGAMSATIEELWQALKAYDALTIAHHPAATIPAVTNWNIVNEEQMPLVEIYSKHGNSEAPGCEEPVTDFVDSGSVQSALLQWVKTGAPGLRLGITGSTDDHYGKPGSVAEDPANLLHDLPTTGGLVGVHAKAKTRSAIFDALMAKQTYATSGPRIGLKFFLKSGQTSAIMGQTTKLTVGASVTMTIIASGEGVDIQNIQLIKGTASGEKVVAEKQDTTRLTHSEMIDGRSYFRVKVFQAPTKRHDGQMVAERAWSSPIFIEL